jgi:hypothetical protein
MRPLSFSSRRLYPADQREGGGVRAFARVRSGLRANSKTETLKLPGLRLAPLARPNSVSGRRLLVVNAESLYYEACAPTSPRDERHRD